MAFIKNNQPTTSSAIIKIWDDILLDAKNKNISTKPFDICAYVSTFDNIEIINDDLGSEVCGIIEYVDSGFVIASSFLELANENPLAKVSYKNFMSEYEKLLNTLKNI